MARRTQKSPALAFANKLVLNQWLVKQISDNPMDQIRSGAGTLRPLQRLQEILNDANLTGVDHNNRHKFAERMRLELGNKATVTRHDLGRYEDNISSHTQAINEGRDRQVVWKYYQWLSLLFTEIYLDRYFTDPHKLRDDLNAYLAAFNAHWAEQGVDTGLSPYILDDLNKICLQNATGSGKTLLMHVQTRQFAHYAKVHGREDDFNRTILLTPNEDLSSQHDLEFKASGLRAQRLMPDRGDLFSNANTSLTRIDFTEFTKLADEDGKDTMAVRNLGADNVLLIDEAHKGMGSHAGAWFTRRSALSKTGFAFEYSATFREASNAAKNAKVEAEYAKSILFDYSYRHFYGDGYGKDYRVFNLPKQEDEAKFSYLCACLLTYYQQMRLYEEKGEDFAPFNIEKPLWVFVGTSVKGGASKDENLEPSDVIKIIQFFAQFLGNPERSRRAIETHLKSGAGFTDQDGAGAFAEAFSYLIELIGESKETAQSLFIDICKRLFNNSSGGELKLRRVKGDSNEIILRAGQSQTDFGLINVGDSSGLAKAIEDAQIDNLSLENSNFSASLFASVSSSSSPINLLIGSKKFVEGWDCWRVSTLGLMNVGRSEGAQIIQLFGRGVRLKGYGWSLQRSGYARPSDRPAHISHVETLNVFGIASAYMARFRDFLEAEGLPQNDEKTLIKIPLNITYDFGQRLMTLRPKRKDKEEREYDFKRDGAVPTFGETISKHIVLDLYDDIESIQSNKKMLAETIKKSHVFSAAHLDLLNYQQLFFDLEKIKRERGWHNINIAPEVIRAQLQKADWYEILAPDSNFTFSGGAQVQRWQIMAQAALKLYLERLYVEKKSAFTEPRLEYRPLEADDPNLPSDEAYRLTVNSDETILIGHINALKKTVESQESGVQAEGRFKTINLGHHLYRPLLHAEKGIPVQFKPAALNESEMQFVEDLHAYATGTEDGAGDIFLLRNESRGKGMGFFEAGNFYPDFLLWLVNGDVQHLAFIEPHGLQHEGPGSPKVRFHKTIKDIEKRLADPKITLDSFILSPTNRSALAWDMDKEDFEEQHIYFLGEDPKYYIGAILRKIST